MEYGWIWIAVLVAAVIVELLTDQLVSIWFAPAAIIATVLDFCGARFVWQILVFLLCAAVGIIIAKMLLGRVKKSESTRTNIDAIIGERCVVTEQIDNYRGCGQVRVGSQIWSARGTKEDDVFEEGEVLNVVAIEGVKLICKR